MHALTDGCKTLLNKLSLMTVHNKSTNVHYAGCVHTTSGHDIFPKDQGVLLELMLNAALFFFIFFWVPLLDSRA